MSADSGLRTYADAMHEVPGHCSTSSNLPKLTYHDLCQPTALFQYPEAFHDFWAGSLRTYRAAAPHDGYQILEALCATKAQGASCVYTSNVDGLFRRFATLRSNLVEIHGCIEEWTCSASTGYARSGEHGAMESRGGIFEAHNAAVERAAAGMANGRSAVSAETLPWAPSCAQLMITPKRAGEGDGSIRGNEELLGCPHCGSPLRPSVVMFGDTDDVLLRRQGRVADAYQEWEERMEAAVSSDPSRASLVVLEIGCGELVPSVRKECEDVVRDTRARGGRAVLIRINPEAGEPAAAVDCAGGQVSGMVEANAVAGQGEMQNALVTIRATAQSGLRRIAAAMADPDELRSGEGVWRDDAYAVRVRVSGGRRA